ncbi:MAG: hypothetical protein ACT4PJ_04920 [Gemmatimonadaceae bacterium]
MAWSGAGRVTRVEVSTDGGSRWNDAELVPLSGDRFGQGMGATGCRCYR